MRALIVDNNVADCAALARYLRQGGYTSLAVDSLRQARRALADQSFDLVLLDSELPDGAAFRFCTEIREQLNKEVVIIFVSNKDTPLRRATGLQLGADDFIGKPCDMEEVLARIDACQRRRRSAT